MELRKTQRRATKIIKGLEKHPHDYKLLHLRLFSLESRLKKNKGEHDWGVQSYTVYGVDKVDKEELFSPSQIIWTKGHPIKFNPGINMIFVLYYR